MPSEAVTQEIKSNNESKIHRDMSKFCFKETFSDVKLIVEGEEICAHKIVLAAKSEFFESLLLQDTKQTELTLTDIPSVEAFKELLKYMYTDTVTTIPEEGIIFDCLKLAQTFSLKDFETDLSNKLNSNLNLTNVREFLNRACLNNWSRLRDDCLNFIDKNVRKVLGSDFFNCLSQTSMKKLLERDSLPLSEIDVFRTAADWCKTNKDNSIMDCVRLHFLSRKQILSEVWPSKLIESDKLLSVMANTEDSENLPRRVEPEEIEFCEETSVDVDQSDTDHVRRVKNENIATSKYQARVISGNNAEELLCQRKRKKYFATHKALDVNGITVDLGALSCFNQIIMRLSNETFQYYIEVSEDRENWNKILDYTEYNCKLQQNLYFPEQKARYIRVVGQGQYTNNNEFKMHSFQVYLRTETPKICDQFVCPTNDVVDSRTGAVVQKSYVMVSAEPRVQVLLVQPYVVSRLRLRWRVDGDKFTVKVLGKSGKSEIVAEGVSENCNDWHTIDFQEKIVNSFIVCSTNRALSNFTVDDVQCFYNDDV